MLRNRWWAALLLAGLAGAAGAQALVAVVEDLRGRPAGVEFMDYVAAGRVIQLGPKDVLVLGYLKSCWRETITGGTVTVGEVQSSVLRGKVERTQVECDASRAKLGAREATQSAATVFRSFRRDASPAPVPPTLYGQSPVFEVGAARGTLVIERLDEAAPRFELAIGGEALLRERFLDLARSGVALVPGGSYTASLGERKLAFKLAPQAAPGAAPLAGRLLRFE
ncbi:MAG: hypothetical protein Q8K45_15135 [Rubrivivax sp.]|nr:hypothetical protein [Rubrivivax sp.]